MGEKNSSKTKAAIKSISGFKNEVYIFLHIKVRHSGTLSHQINIRSF